MYGLKIFLLRLLMNRHKAAVVRQVMFVLYLVMDFCIIASIISNGISITNVILSILFVILGVAVNIYETLYNRKIEILKDNSLKNIILAEPSIHKMYMFSIWTFVVICMYYKNLKIGINLSLVCFILLILIYFFSIYISKIIAGYYEDKINK